MTFRRLLGVMTIGVALLLAGCTASQPDADPVPSASASPTPSATPTPTRDPAGVVAFGGDCAAVLSSGEVTEIMGLPMRTLAAQWSPGADHRLGGVQCAWSSDGVYMGAQLSVYVYPVETAAIVADGPDLSGCVHAYYWVDCSTTTSVGDMWIWVSAGLPGDTAPDLPTRLTAAAAAIGALVADRAAMMPEPYAATRGEDWWQFADCADAVETFAAAGALPAGSRVDGRWGVSTGPPTLAARHGLRYSCPFVYDADDGSLMHSYFALWPGGGDEVTSGVAAGIFEPISVPGAAAAAVAPSLDALEGHGSLLVATDGPNLIAVDVDFDGLSEANVTFMAGLLAALAAR